MWPLGGTSSELGPRANGIGQIFLHAASYESMASLDMAYHVLRANPVAVLVLESTRRNLWQEVWQDVSRYI